MALKKSCCRTIFPHTWQGVFALVLCIAAGVFGTASDAISILVIRPDRADFVDAEKGLKDDLGEEYLINNLVISEITQSRDVALAIRLTKPKMLILMDNKAVGLYRHYQKTAPPVDSVPIPTVTLMAIVATKAIAGMQNACAISYEIPIVTSAVGLRTLVGKPITTIGIIHREVMHDLVLDNRVTCAQEQITLVNRCLPNRVRFRWFAIQKLLRELLEKEKVDALWIPNDNVILEPYLIEGVWSPLVNKYKKPVITGIEVLVSPELEFGTLAVMPDHIALGAQAAALVVAARDNNWQVKNGTVEPAFSVIKVLNAKGAKKCFAVTKENMNGIDKVLE